MEAPATPAPKDLAETLHRTAGGSNPALSALLTHSAIGLALFDTEPSCTWVNEAMGLHNAIPRHKRVGHRPQAALPACRLGPGDDP
jgi:hypothetical protein